MFGSNNKSRIVSIVKTPEGEDAADTEPPPLEVETAAAPDPDDNKYRKETRRLPAWAAVAVLLYLLSVLGLVILMDNRLPAALTTADIPDNPDTFIEERARRTLRALTSIGARPAGSYENEVLAVDLLRRELQSIKERSHPSHKLTVDIQVNWVLQITPDCTTAESPVALRKYYLQVMLCDILQKPRGSFNLQFVDGLTHSYRNIQNVVAKLESGTGAKHSLLVNCHFDSVPQSAGKQ